MQFVNTWVSAAFQILGCNWVVLTRASLEQPVAVSRKDIRKALPAWVAHLGNPGNDPDPGAHSGGRRGVREDSVLSFQGFGRSPLV